MRPEPRAELLGLTLVPHGGDAPAGVVDYSTGISPLPAPCAILDAARDADLSRYPHPTAAPFRAAIAALHARSPDGVVAGAGSVELIGALARAFAGAGRTGLVVTPAFGEYQQALRVSGADVIELPTVAPAFELSMAALERAVNGRSVAMVFLCRPSNPCLNTFDAEVIAAAARRWPGTLFVVDEAYQPMFEGVAPLAPTENVVVLRSMTKVFALPGLRLGYLLASPAIAGVLQTVLPPWNVSAPAQAAGIVAARLLPDQVADLRRAIARLREGMRQALAALGAAPEAAGGPFLLYRVADARGFTERLLTNGVRVRHAASLGLPEHLRLGVRGEAEVSTLVQAWRAATAS